MWMMIRGGREGFVSDELDQKPFLRSPSWPPNPFWFLGFSLQETRTPSLRASFDLDEDVLDGLSLDFGERAERLQFCFFEGFGFWFWRRRKEGVETDLG